MRVTLCDGGQCVDGIRNTRDKWLAVYCIASNKTNLTMFRGLGVMLRGSTGFNYCYRVNIRETFLM